MGSSLETAPGFLSVGQPVARATAVRLVTRRSLARPLLVHGPRGSGKGSFLADVMALLVCRTPDPLSGPCNACDACVRSRHGTHPDVVLASPGTWAASRQSNESLVAVARRWLVEIAGAPIDGERRVVVIEQADGCNESIQNALLKALEEPAPRHVFVLVADDAARLLPTIRSRCQPLRIGPVPHAELVRWLSAKPDVAADRAELLARLSQGRIGLASRFMERQELVSWRERVQRELLALLPRGRSERFGALRDLLEEAARLDDQAGIDPPEADAGDGEVPPAAARTPAARQRVGATAIVDVWLSLARDLVVASAGRVDAAFARDTVPDLASAARRVGPVAATRFTRRLEEIRAGLAVNVSPRLALEVAMLEWPTLDAAA
ncbi:MAG: ATP-binding protein [Candidatus Limnocylindria bacterium]